MPIVAVLAQHLNLDASKHMIWEPAAGKGLMAAALADAYPKATVVPSGLPDADFFNLEGEEMTTLSLVSTALITNPPYDLAQEFVEKALEYKAGGGTVAMLLRSEWLHAASREHLGTREAGFHAKIELLWRPRWFEDGTESPRHNFAWFVWTPGKKNPPHPKILFGNKPADESE